MRFITADIHITVSNAELTIARFYAGRKLTPLEVVMLFPIYRAQLNKDFLFLRYGVNVLHTSAVRGMSNE